MDRNIQNVEEVREETDLKAVNRLLKDGWIIVTTEKTSYFGDGAHEATTYILGRLKIE